MAKLSLQDITSGYASTAALNANFAAIEEAVENTLSRDGTTPNQMEADLDLNGYRILNQANAITVEGFNLVGDWATATAYAVGDIVQEASSSYICKVAHTSGTFATDVSSDYWQLLAAGTLPDQSGNSGKYLSTDGLVPSWEALSLDGLTADDFNVSTSLDITGKLALTNSTAGPAVKITHTGTGDTLVVEDGASDASPFVIDANGNVIINHTAKVADWDGFNIASTATVSRPISISMFSNSGTAYPAQLILSRSRSGTRGTKANVVAGDYLGQVHFYGVASDDATYVSFASIIGNAVAEENSGYARGSLTFITGNPLGSTSTSGIKLTVASGLVSASTKLGYAGYDTSSGGNLGGSVTQTTSKSTGVTLNKVCGQVVTHNAALGAGVQAEFTVTNSYVKSTDVIILSHSGTGSTGSAYELSVTTVQNGSFNICIKNKSPASLSQAITINFAIINSTATI